MTSFVRSACIFATVAVLALARAPLATADPPAPAAVTVDTKNYAYAPPTVIVPAGTTVVFKNSDGVAHTVTASDKSFDSGDMQQGGTWSHVFATAGTYAYVCAYHHYMQGTVVVR